MVDCWLWAVSGHVQAGEDGQDGAAVQQGKLQLQLPRSGACLKRQLQHDQC